MKSSISTTKRVRGVAAALAFFVMVGGVIVPEEAAALAFRPNETEWLTWPDYCRARYLASGAGRRSNYTQRVSTSEIEMFENQIGQDAWHWLHHYCSGLVFLSRAKAAENRQERERLFEEAKSQMMGQYQRVPQSDPFFGIVATSIGRVHWEKGEPAEAIGFLRESMQAQPTYTAAYSLASLIYRDSGEMDKALGVLLEGDKANGGQSAEIHYFLGLLLIETGDLDSAVVHARKAYSLGYPLPGLMAKLERLGKTLD